MSDPAEVVSSQVLRAWPLPDVDDGAGKGARGTVVVVGGAADTPGAVLLSGIAALRVGAGRLRIATAAVTPPTTTSKPRAPSPNAWEQSWRCSPASWLRTGGRGWTRAVTAGSALPAAVTFWRARSPGLPPAAPHRSRLRSGAHTCMRRQA